VSRRTPPRSSLRPIEASRKPDQPIQWVDTARYLGVVLDTGSTCSTHINNLRKKAAERLRVLGSLQNRRSGFSIKEWSSTVQAFHPSYDGRRIPAWWSTARSHIRKMEVLQTRCLRIATNAS
jgi:hypothetical protein